MRGYSFISSGESQALSSCCLDTYLAFRDVEYLGKPLAHGFAVWSNFWCLANQGHVNIDHAAAAFFD